ncbi:MAG: metal-dependent hydrolase, partial [Planctomycetota bacterium]
MANFETHLSFAAIGSGLLATTCLGAGLVDARESMMLWILGTAGGILPDIDSTHSSAIRMIFSTMAVIVAWFATLNWVESYSILELWIVCGSSYILVRYVALKLFSKFTVHRGIFHSIASCAFFAFGLTSIGFHFLRFNEFFSWMMGLFLAIGFLIHLCLDECYSVDLMNVRMKKSFGTALKLFDYKNWKTSLVMIGVMILAFFWTPNPEKFKNFLTDSKTYQKMQLIPSKGWFNQWNRYNNPVEKINP